MDGPTAGRRRRSSGALGLLGLIAWLGLSPAEAWAEVEPAQDETVQAPSLEALCQELLVPDPLRRVAAIRQLGALGDPGATVPLAIAARQDPIAEVRGWALRALHQLGSEGASQEAIEAARQDPDERILELALTLFPGADLQLAPEPPPTPRAAQPQEDLERARPAPPRRPERQRRPGQRLITSGWLTLGGAYGLSMVLGLIVSFGYPEVGFSQLVPVFGSIAGVAVNASDDELNAVHSVAVLLNVAQLTGVILLATGYARRRRQERRRSRISVQRVSLVPAGPAGAPGLTLGGIF